jgi:hypothetical protein
VVDVLGEVFEVLADAGLLHMEALGIPPVGKTFQRTHSAIHVADFQYFSPGKSTLGLPKAMMRFGFCRPLHV